MPSVANSLNLSTIRAPVKPCPCSGQALFVLRLSLIFGPKIASLEHKLRPSSTPTSPMFRPNIAHVRIKHRPFLKKTSPMFEANIAHLRPQLMAYPDPKALIFPRRQRLIRTKTPYLPPDIYPVSLQLNLLLRPIRENLYPQISQMNADKAMLATNLHESTRILSILSNEELFIF